ncbi:hypothetical protein FACS1894191_3120 [Clostridia bacterium]|nr:hypothetical protein FACS1894191_3120 [Clostridia bacterium]
MKIEYGGSDGEKTQKGDYGTGIPKHEVEALARCLLPEIQKFFETEDGKREFEEWKAKQGQAAVTEGKPGK